MAFTRKMLKALGIEDDKIETIMDEHVAVTEALKQERDTYKTKADRLDEVQRELDEQKAKGDESWKDKYEQLQRDVDAKETKEAKERAYRDMLKDVGLSERGVEKALKYANWESIELDADGKIKDVKNHVATAKEEWSDYVVTTSTTGAPTSDPPRKGGGSVKTMDEIYAMKDGRYVLSPAERQAELAKLYQTEKGE